MDFDYKKYSLEQLDSWVNDAMSSGGATPQEIYDVIIAAVRENYYSYKHQASKAYELLTLLNSSVGNIKEFDDCVDKILSCDRDDPSPKCKKSWDSFWNDSMPPWGHSDMEASRYTEEELNAMCEKAKYDDEYRRDQKNFEEILNEDGYAWTPKTSSDCHKVKKWVLPIEVDGLTGDLYIKLPDDLLEQANLKEGDMIEWIQNDGSYTIKKFN